jgi:hypothetical protein
MSKRGKGSEKKQKGGNNKTTSSGSGGRGLIEIDPQQIFFTHSRVRPFFTGCNKKIEETLQEIVTGVTSIKDIPLITVIPNEDCYFSLNNRRLFLFKRLREMGLLQNNTITAYAKAPLEREKQRYLPSRCSLTAKLMKEFEKSAAKEGDDEADEQEQHEDPLTTEPSISEFEGVTNEKTVQVSNRHDER